MLRHLVLLTCAKAAFGISVGVSSAAVIRSVRNAKKHPYVDYTGEATCSGKLAFYHWDGMAPYGFGCQYNHWITFLSVALLEERTPVELGNWSLTCPREGKVGFWDCFSTKPRRTPSCKPAHNVYVSKFSKRIHGEGHLDFFQSEYGQHMRALDNRELDEWHLDGDMIRGHGGGAHDRDRFRIQCSDEQPPADPWRGNSWTPRASSTFARKMCAETGLPHMDVVQVFRYVAQRVVPLLGLDEAKQKCRALWGSKVALAIHVRRGDKVGHEDRAYGVKEYVQAASKNGWKFDVVHIVTDDPTAVEKEMHCDKFSMLQDELHVGCTQLEKGKDGLKKLEIGGSFYSLLNDVACLAEADYLIGSSKSNIPWLAQTLRKQAPETALGLEGESLAMP